ncbi:hypothetical protein G3480_05105 [Thiorhodococcus mannitoliphagus]|uniref:Antitermination protein NusG n=1 Tax=Thiorhodococcus mannitoliphagus TaxID=329406 RepID=A0A6P1DN75_9GAMM|nr:hypothetical protein [Thiorhodococcus mannitoliphagus]NEX19697.1 hypothetical protein [Thiorhodococcus mannitoliphagus]
MIGKLALTLLVLFGAYAVLRARWRSERVARGLEPPSAPLLPRGAARLAAAVVLAIMAGGSVLVMLQGWLETREVVQVQVVNANTGEVITYRAHRGDVGGRQIQTLDGRQVRLADVERMIILPVDSPAAP